VSEDTSLCAFRRVPFSRSQVDVKVRGEGAARCEMNQKRSENGMISSQLYRSANGSGLHAFGLRALTLGLGRAVAPGGRRGKLLILCYHRVLPKPDPLIPDGIDREAFDGQMRIVAEHFNALPMTEAISRLRAGTLPPRAIGITFDDGYADNYTVALPILRKYAVPATVFVAAAFLDGGRMWNDTIIESVRRARGDSLDLSHFDLGVLPVATPEERGITAGKVARHLRRLPADERNARVEEFSALVGAELPTDLMLSSEQVVQLHGAGVEIGAHTLTHPILARLPDSSAEQEIGGCRERLAGLLGTRIAGFAYPNGVPGVDYHRVHVDAVHRSGYAYAVTTAQGCASAAADRFQLPRLMPWTSHPSKFALRLMKEYTSGTARTV
jgi:peptidoglycan/xylan/chitin deacetylase (PgdA/CDA1 family)